MRQTLLPSIAALLALAACGQEPSQPDRAPQPSAAPPQACAQFPQEADDGEATRPEVPRAFAAYVEATETTITVRREPAPPACIDISYGEVDTWDSLAGGRLLGLGILGHEYNSYLVIDRMSAAEPVETGRAPAFSSSGQRFASVDVSGSGFGAFEGLGVWEVTDGGIGDLVIIRNLLERGYDWKLERWASEDCVVFSSTDEATPDAPDDRKFYHLRLAGRPVLQDIAPEDACRASA